MPFNGPNAYCQTVNIDHEVTLAAYFLRKVVVPSEAPDSKKFDQTKQ